MCLVHTRRPLTLFHLIPTCPPDSPYFTVWKKFDQMFGLKQTICLRFHSQNNENYLTDFDKENCVENFFRNKIMPLIKIMTMLFLSSNFIARRLLNNETHLASSLSPSVAWHGHCRGHAARYVTTLPTLLEDKNWNVVHSLVDANQYIYRTHSMDQSTLI